MDNSIYCVLILIILFLIYKNYSRKVIWFYRPDCLYCRQMEPEWAKFQFKARFSILPPIEVKKININDAQNAHIVDNYDVKGVPFIVKLERDGIRNIYNDKRVSENLFKWACS